MMIRFFILFILPCFVLSQKTKNEKLIQEYYTVYKTNTDSDLDKAYAAIKKAYNLSNELDIDSWKAKTAYGMGYCNYLYEKDSVSNFFFDKAISFSRQENDIETLSKALNMKGNIYGYQSNNKKALEYYHESIKYSGKIDKLSSNTANVLGNIADIYVIEHDTINALKYYHEAIKIEKKRGLGKSLSNSYNNLGVLFMSTQKDSALFYINQSLELAIKNKLENNLINKYLNIGVIYLNFNDVKNYNKAKINLIKALKLSKKEKSSRYQFQSNLYLGIYYNKAEKNYTEAKKYLEDALLFLNKEKDQEYNIELYKALSEVYVNTSDYRKAFTYKDLENKLVSDVFNLEKNKQIHEIQTEFDVERKNLQIDLLHLEKQNKEIENFWIITVSLVSILGLIIIGIIYKSREKKKRLLLQQENEIKRISEVVKSQDDERNRIAKELHDGVGNRLSVFKQIIHQEIISENDIDYLKTNTKDLMKEVREISHHLSLSFIHQASIVDLILKLIESYQNKLNIDVEFSIYPEDALAKIIDERKQNLYRILQEILTNVEKHADAKNINITITKIEKHITLIIEDNGKGFDYKDEKNGIGISNIMERIELINGKLTIDSEIGFGTTFLIEVDEE